MKIKILSGLVLSAFLFGSSAFAQEEYDDLYFSKKDRIKKERKVIEKRVVKPSVEIGTENQSVSKYANPDFQGGAIMDDAYTPTYNYYDEALARDGRVYDENYRPGMGGFYDPWMMNDPFLRNRMMRDPFLRQRMMTDPFFFDRMMMGGMGMGMAPGFGSGLRLGFGTGFGMGMGMGFGNPWMMYDPFFDPFMNPWMMSPGFGWGMGSSFAMNSMYWNRFGWNPFFGGGNVMVIERQPRTRIASAPSTASMAPDRLQQLRSIPDSERKYPSRIRNFDRRSLQNGTDPNGRYSRSTNTFNGNSSPYQRSSRSYQSPRSSDWGSSSPNYRQSSSPTYRSSSPSVSPSRSTRSIRRN